jgi:glycerophosphoryl diester phosphodiesterase
VRSKVLLYAHRGAAAERPENTLPSFERALELGADVLEMDVHATRDGALVVSHDPDGERMCGVARDFADASWDEVRGWDAGWGFTANGRERPFAGKGCGVPRFEDVMAAFPTVPLNVDLKAPVADEAVALVRRMGAEERVGLASFSTRTMRRVRALGYRGGTALAQWEAIHALATPRLFMRGPLRVAATAAQLPSWMIRPLVVRRCHALGLRVDVWTVNLPAEARRMIALGVDGIMTDDPACIAPVVHAIEEAHG